jgi:hypothetical protein
MSVEKRSNVYHDDKICCASCCSCSLSSLFLAKLHGETTVQSIAQQQQIEEIVATAIITERANGACRNEHNKGL